MITLVERNPKLFAELINEILNTDPVVAMRAADAVEKLSAVHPEWLVPHKKLIVTKLIPIEQKEIRWHVAQMLARLNLTSSEVVKVTAILEEWLEVSDSRIVQVMSLQALVDLAELYPKLRAGVEKKLVSLSKSDVPALRSRSKKLLRELDGFWD